MKELDIWCSGIHYVILAGSGWDKEEPASGYRKKRELVLDEKEDLLKMKMIKYDTNTAIYK